MPAYQDGKVTIQLKSWFLDDNSRTPSLVQTKLQKLDICLLVKKWRGLLIVGLIGQMSRSLLGKYTWNHGFHIKSGQSFHISSIHIRFGYMLTCEVEMKPIDFGIIV